MPRKNSHFHLLQISARYADAVKGHFRDHTFDERDGLWFEHQGGWVQIRKSNTEPIMRIYAEGRTVKEADDLADSVIGIVKKL